jgi:hypothetical protein
VILRGAFLFLPIPSSPPPPLPLVGMAVHS